MEITLLKPYLNHSAGDTIEVSDFRGIYLKRVGVAESNETQKEIKQPCINKPKPKKQTKSKSSFKTEITDKQNKI